MDKLDAIIDAHGADSVSSSSESLELIEIKEADPELENEFAGKVLKIYLKEMYRDLLNREVDGKATKLSLKVFSEYC